MDTEQQKQILETEKASLVNELNTIAVQDETTGDWVARPDDHSSEADPNVFADITEDWNESRAMVAQLETRYHNVNLALKKFSTGTYGQCEVCQEAVESERLAVNPAARTCKMHLERERELPF